MIPASCRRPWCAIAIVAVRMLMLATVESFAPLIQQQPAFLNRRSARPFTLPPQQQQPNFFLNMAMINNSDIRIGDDDDDDFDDIPADWTEDDIVKELQEMDETAAAIIVGDDDDDSAIEDEDVDVVSKLASEIDLLNMDVDDLELDIDDDEDDIEIDEDDDLIEETSYDYDDNDDNDSLLVANAAAGGIAEWDEEEDGGDYELQDDPDDPNYTKQKELVEAAIEASKQRAAESIEDIVVTPEQMEQLPFYEQIQERFKTINTLTPEDIEGVTTDLDDAVANAPDLLQDEPYPRHEPGEINLLENYGLTDDDLEELDDVYKDVAERVQQPQWNKLTELQEAGAYDNLSNDTIDELNACAKHMLFGKKRNGTAAYDIMKWLKYDLSFNVSNLMLAAVKHNPTAPVLFAHWYPQLVHCERYQQARDRNYEFNMDDVQQADLEELKTYYAGFGYEEIPTKAPAETGIINVEELDEEETKMAAFENWIIDVYNPECDRKDLDDEDITDEDNIFSDEYITPQHPDRPLSQELEDEVEDWLEEREGLPAAVAEAVCQLTDYELVHDEEFQKEFRGHLIIACSGSMEDLDTAEMITARFRKEFGKQLWVETRVISLATDEDNVFEIWLESFNIDLLHSKHRAMGITRNWDGPAEVDAKQLEYLVDKVGYLISDDSRYSYFLESEYAEYA
jgi:hypothetical protein